MKATASVCFTLLADATIERFASVEINTDPANRARCFAILAEHADKTLGCSLLRRAAAVVTTLESEKYEIASLLVPRLVARGLVAEARGLIDHVEPGDPTTAALAALPMTPEVMQTALETIASTGEVFRAAAISPMLPHFSVEALQNIARAAEEMHVDLFADAVRAVVVDGMASRELEIAKEIAKTIGNASNRASAHASLAAHSRNPGPHIAAALAAMRDYGETAWRSDFESALSIYDKPFRSIIMASIASRSWRAELVEQLAPKLDSSVAEPLVAEALADDDAQFAILGSAHLLSKLPETGPARGTW
ncbi:hypothetical protein [Sinorhizobium sp. BG8]|uniref:hypothetical protein n=1 Tax=Sinorhizobium sp. BG8 TaxID=2613773 RepID=UPI00193D4925|nr:hypothetical protein [Sinorhizobium sp. BG8]QRM57248.1 hypothetical protein F3Y30_22330 [Sinorhizobium sp. BG8]